MNTLATRTKYQVNNHNHQPTMSLNAAQIVADPNQRSMEDHLDPANRPIFAWFHSSSNSLTRQGRSVHLKLRKVNHLLTYHSYWLNTYNVGPQDSKLGSNNYNSKGLLIPLTN